MGALRILLVLLLGVVTSQAKPFTAALPKATPVPTVSPEVTLSLDAVRKTIEHNEMLTAQLKTQLTASNQIVTSQAAQIKTLTDEHAADKATMADWTVQDKALNKRITDLEAKDIWDSWKYSIISIIICLPLGFLACMFGKTVEKGAETAAVVATKIP